MTNNVEALIESFRVEISELRQEFETFKFNIQEMLTSSFNKIINKVEEMGKNDK